MSLLPPVRFQVDADRSCNWRCCLWCCHDNEPNQTPRTPANTPEPDHSQQIDRQRSGSETRVKVIEVTHRNFHAPRPEKVEEKKD